MKTTTLFLTAFLLFNFAQAQLSLSHFFPGNPKTAIGVSVEPLGNPAGGQNLTWDFSTNNPSGEDFQVHYVAPTQEIGTRFPGSNRAMKISDGGADAYFAFRETAEGWVQTGLLTAIDGEIKASEFVNPKLYLPSNLLFGNEVTDNFYSKMDLGSQGIEFNINTGGQVKTKVDATGTIVLPNGQTISGVTRLYTEENYTDTVNLVIPGFPAEPELILGRTKLYNWYKNDGSGNPLVFSLVQDSTFAEGEWTVTVSAFYLVSGTTANKDKMLITKRLPFPNQVSDVVHIPFDTHENKPVQIQITDASGKQVLFKEVEELKVENNHLVVAMGHLKPGTYLLQLQSKDGKPEKPFRIQKL